MKGKEYKRMTVDDLRSFLDDVEGYGSITGETEIWIKGTDKDGKYFDMPLDEERLELGTDVEDNHKTYLIIEIGGLT